MVCEVLAVAPQQQGPACTSKLDPHLGEEEQQASDTSASEGTTYLLQQCPTPAALASQQQQQHHHHQTPLGTSTLAAAPGASCCTSSGQQYQVSSRAGSVQSVNTAALDAAVLAAARHNGPQQQQQQQQPQVVRQMPGSLWRGQHSSSTTRDAHPPAHSRSCDDHAPKQQQAGGQQQQHGTGCMQLSAHQQQQQQQVQLPCRSRSDQGKLLSLLNRYSGLTKQHLSGCIIPQHSVVLPPRPPQQQQQQQHAKPLQQPSPAATAAGRCLACSPSKPGWCARCRQQQAVHTQQRPPAAGCPQHTPQRHWQAQPPHLHRQMQQQQPQGLSQQQQQQSETQVHAWRWWQDHSGRYGDILPRLDELRPLLQMHAAAAAADTLQQVLSPRRELGPVPAAVAAAAAGGSGGGDVTVCQQQAVAGAQQAQLTIPRQRQGQAPPPLQPLPTHQQQQPRQGHVADASSAPVPPAAAAATVVAAVPSALPCPGADAAPGGGGWCASSCPKPPKRPWQPRMAPDEPNWNQAAFVDIQSRYGASYAQPPAGNAGSKGWPRTLPEHSTATFAQLMLLHGAGWPNHLMWERWQQAHPAGSLTMFVHMKQGVVLSPGMPGRDLIARTKLKVSLDSRWGDISLVEATLLGLEEVLRRCPHVAHIGLSSGHDVPVQLIRPGLLLPGVSLFGLYQFGAPEMETLQSAVLEELLEVSALTPTEAAAWKDALTFHHQWMVLSREHAAALVHHKREILMIGRLLHKACCSVRAGMAPDEFIIITALKQLRLVRSVQRVEVKPHMRYPPGTLLNSYPTFVVFPAVSSPHPVLWTHLDKKVRCQVEKNTGQQYHTLLSLNDCLDLAVERCGIYFRKIEVRPTATDQLVMLLSSLEAMWAGQRKGSTTALKTSSGSTTTGNKAGSNSRRGGGGGSSSNKRRHNSPNPSAGTGSTPQTSQDAAADATSPTSSAACDTTAAAAVVGTPDAAAAGVGGGGGVSLSSGGCGAPDGKRRRSSVEAGS